jgi:hypothetical protein
MENESFVIDDVIMYVYNYEVGDKIHEYLSNHEIAFDYFTIYYDEALRHIYENVIREENQVLYVEVVYFTRTSMTVYINNEVLVNNEFRIGLDFVRYEIIDYLVMNDLYNTYEFVIYLDSEYQILWNQVEFEDMILYVLLLDTTLTTTLNVIYNQETILTNAVNLGSINIDPMRYEVMTYFSSHDIYADDIAFYVDEALTIKWDGYVRENLTVYVKNIVFEITEVTVYLNQNMMFTVNVLMGYNESYILENSIHDYLNEHDISFDYVEIFMDSSLVMYWDYYITEQMTVYLHIIYYERTTLYLHIDEFLLELEDIQVNRRDHYKINDAVINYLNSQSIPWDRFTIFEDEDFAIEFDYYPSEFMHLYIDIIVFERTNVTVHIDQNSLIIENIIVDNIQNDQLRNSIQNYLYEQNIEHDTFEVYIDDNYSNLWDYVVLENMHVYVKIIIYPVTTVQVEINDYHLICSDIKLNGSNYYAIYQSIYDYMNNNIAYNDYKIYKDPSFMVEWDTSITEDMILYVKIIIYTMDQHLAKDFYGHSEAILLSDDFTIKLLGDYSGQEFYPETYYITFEDTNYFIYAVYMTNGTYAYLHMTLFLDFYHLSIEDALSSQYDGELISSLELTTIAEINTSLSGNFETWEEFLYEFSLHEYLEVYVIENEWLINENVVRSIDIVLGYQGYYRFWAKLL